MTIVLDTTPVRFTPADLVDTPGAPVYLIAPGTSRTRAVFRRELTAQGVQYPAAAVMYETLRDGVRYGIAAHLRDGWLDLIDQAEEVASRRTEALRAAAEAAAAEGVDGVDGALAKLPELSARERVELATIESDIRRHYPPYAAVIADQQFYMDMAPIVAAQHFLVDWENVGHPFERVRGVVDLALLDHAVGDAHTKAIGFRAMALLRPDATAEKNSPSRPGSPAGRGTSTEASKPSTGRAGKSRAKSTRKTPAT